MIYALIIAVIVALIVSFAMVPKPQTTPPSGLNDIQLPEAEVGASIPVLFGTKNISGSNVVWYGDLRTVAIKKKGGKK